MARLDAEIALRENRIDHARRTVTEALDLARVRGQLTAHAWLLLITGAAIEVRARASARERREAGDFAGALRSVAADLPIDAPPWRACAKQFAAEMESNRSASPAWYGVVAAWEKAGNPYPLC